MRMSTGECSMPTPLRSMPTPDRDTRAHIMGQALNLLVKAQAASATAVRLELMELTEEAPPTEQTAPLTGPSRQTA